MTATTFLALVISQASVGVARADCFPIERLPAELRPRAEQLLLKIMDGEGLYTVVGGLKPMSSGWLSHRVSVEKPELADAERDRRILATFRSGEEIVANVQPFWRVYEGKRFLDGVIYHRSGVARAIRDHGSYFAFYGVTPSSEPVEAAMAFELDGTSQRNRGYGYLFGYPDHAVNFFVSADEEMRKTKKLVPRDFLHIPTFASATHRFVYAVPKGQAPNEADLRLRAEAAPILAMYRQLRPRYVGEGKRGIVALLRDWFDDGKGRCSSATALMKARSRAR